MGLLPEAVQMTQQTMLRGQTQTWPWKIWVTFYAVWMKTKLHSCHSFHSACVSEIRRGWGGGQQVYLCMFPVCMWAGGVNWGRLSQEETRWTAPRKLTPTPPPDMSCLSARFTPRCRRRRHDTLSTVYQLGDMEEADTRVFPPLIVSGSGNRLWSMCINSHGYAFDWPHVLPSGSG